MRQKEIELRDQIQYYKNKFVTDDNENKMLREENAKLKAEIEMLKAEKMLIAPKS
jgi:cell division protein FtsB